MIQGKRIRTEAVLFVLIFVKVLEPLFPGKYEIIGARCFIKAIFSVSILYDLLLQLLHPLQLMIEKKTEARGRDKLVLLNAC